MGQTNDGMAKRDDDLTLRLFKVLAIMAIKDLSQTDQIALLDRIGFAPREMAELIGTTSNTVRVALVSIRKSAAQGKRRGRPMRMQKEDEYA